MNFGMLRKMKLVNLIVCLAFCLNLGLSGNALASVRVEKASASMLRPKSASDKVENTVLGMGIEMIRDILKNSGPKGLKAKLADLTLDKVTDPIEKELIEKGIGILQRKERIGEKIIEKIYVICLIDNGWKVDLSKEKVEVEPFTSPEEKDAFISSGQLTWIAGEYTPQELIDAQNETDARLIEAGEQGRIFRPGDLRNQVAKYSAIRTSVARQLPPLATHEDPKKDEQKKLVARLQPAFAFDNSAINSITQEDINAMFAIGLSPDSLVKVGAETFSFEGGSAVGPININHLKEIGIKDSLVGHSATREADLYRKNADGTIEKIGSQEGDIESEVSAKVQEAFQNKMKITLCVGENIKIREIDKNAVGFVLGQLEEDLGKFNFSGEEVLDLLEAVAYEPIWAIDTGVSAQAEQIQEMLAAIRKWFADKYGEEVAKKISLLYGGSVKVENAKATFAVPDCDGALIAGASLRADSFAKIAEIAETTGKKMRIFANWKAYEYAKRDALEAHLKALASVNLKNTVVTYYLPFTLLTGAQDALNKAKSLKLAEVKEDLKKVDPAIVLDEEENPSFYYKGKVGTSRYLAVTLTSGRQKYPGYDFEKAGRRGPRSTYEMLAMRESYMEMAKTDPQALRAYGLKRLHDYFEISSDSRLHRQERQEVIDLINKYDQMALDMWKQREAVKAKAKLERESRKVVAGLTSANIAKFLDPKLDGMIPDALVAVANAQLAESGLLTDAKAFANADDIHILTTRKNKNAVEDDAKVLPALVKVYLSVLDQAKKTGIYKGEDLSRKTYLEQVRALEIRKEYMPLKYLERAADPYAVISASNTYAGAFNMLTYQILNDPMYCAGITIDPTSFQGFIFEVWDSVEDKIMRFDGLTERNKLLTYINQPGRYASVAGYGKPGYKVPTDEPIFMVSVKRVGDDGKSQVGDFSPVLMIRGQSGLPAWGEVLAPAGTVMPILTYGGDKTRGILAMRPTNIAEANKIPASQRRGISILTGFGFQSHDDGYIGISEDIGGHQTMAPARENAEKWAELFFGSKVTATVVQKGATAYATMDNVEVSEKIVLVRPDINVPAENVHIKDIERPQARVIEAVKTLKELSDKKAKVVVIFHQGRPKDPDFMGTADEHAAQVSKLIGRPVKVVNDLYGEEAIAAIKALKPGEILFLKPVRAADPANPGKILEDNPLFIKNLKPLIDIFVLDGFSVAHRASPSVTGFEGVPAVAGRLMERELKGASNLLNPPQPQLVIVGGGKVTEKLTEMVASLESGKAAKVVVGGRLANLALIASQPEAAEAETPEAQYKLAVVTVGQATADDLKEFLGEIPRLAQVITKYKDKIELPTDMVYSVGQLSFEGEARQVVKLIAGRVPEGFNHLLSGIGPETAKAYAAVASRTAQPFASAFVIGPLSDSRYPVLQEEMRVVLEAVSKLGFWSDGGGDTGELVEQLGFTPSYRSLAGGALAEYKAGKVLPGVKYLTDNNPVTTASVSNLESILEKMQKTPQEKVRVGINGGAGRIGTTVLRVLFRDLSKQAEVVAINDAAFNFSDKSMTPEKYLREFANMLYNDTVHHQLAQDIKREDIKVGKEVRADKTYYYIDIKGKKIYVSDGKDPAQLPWKEHNVEVVFEATGRFTDKESAAKHLQGGAKLVIISAPPKASDVPTFVMGVNESMLDKTQDKVISNASCTTNCLAPITAILQQAFGIKSGVMDTVHAYTNDQATVDIYRPSAPMRGKAASENILTTSTGAAKAIGEVIPELKGKLDGIAERVPVADASLLIYTVNLEKPTTKQAVNRLFKDAASGPLKGILAYEDEEIASTSVIGRSESSIVIGSLTQVSPDGKTVTVRAWYDNEFGYSARMLDLAQYYKSKFADEKEKENLAKERIATVSVATPAVAVRQLPKYMDHITKLEPFLRPHTYNRDDEVVATRERLNSRFKRNPVLKEGESDPLLQKRGDYTSSLVRARIGRSNIKADIGSVPGHYKPHRITIRALMDILMIAKTYGFKGVTQFINLTRAVTVLRTGYTIDELVSKDGLYRKSGSEVMMKKANEFINANKVVDWDTGLAYVQLKHKEALAKIEKEYKGKILTKEQEEGKQEKIVVVEAYYGGMESVISSLKDAQIDYAEFTKKVVADSMADALNYFTISEEKVSPARLEILSIMDGLTAVSAKNLFDTNAAITKALGLTTDLTEDEKILDFKVWSAGDDCQLTMDHKRLSEDKFIHTLAWDALWYAADQTSYFKPYGWKQDILVDRLVSGNIQGAGAGYAEVQVLEGENVLIFSSDKSAPGAFTVPILGMTRKARAEGRFPNGLFYEVWDINNKPRIFFYSEFPEDMQDMLTLLSSPEEFAIKRVWGLKKKWDGKEPIENVLDDLPLISASTERLVLTAGTYVGKDDPTFIVRLTEGGLTQQEVIDIFQYPQVTLGFMRGSHVGPLVPGTQPSFFFGKDKPQDFLPEATPHLFDGPPPITGLVLVAGKPLSEARDVFADAPWLKEVIDQGNFITQVLRRQGAFPPHKIEGPDTEYTTAPEVMAAVEAEGRAKPGSNEQEAQFLKSLLALQSKGVVLKLSDGVFRTARDAANQKVILISARVLRSDPSLILALQSINEQINQNLNVWGSTANIEANAYKFILIADDPALKTVQDVQDLFAEIAKATNNAAKADKGMFAQILTQENMDEGSIFDSVALIQQLKRMGISEELLVAFVGFREWSDGLKAQQGISENTLSVYADAKGKNQIAFAANALFGAVELVATKDRQLVASLAKKLELVQEATSIAVVSSEMNSSVTDEIESYREQIERKFI